MIVIPNVCCSIFGRFSPTLHQTHLPYFMSPSSIVRPVACLLGWNKTNKLFETNKFKHSFQKPTNLSRSPCSLLSSLVVPPWSVWPLPCESRVQLTNTAGRGQDRSEFSISEKEISLQIYLENVNARCSLGWIFRCVLCCRVLCIRSLVCHVTRLATKTPFATPVDLWYFILMFGNARILVLVQLLTKSV